MQISQEEPGRMITEIQHLTLPAHHEVQTKDVDIKRLGSILWLAHDTQPKDFEELLSSISCTYQGVR